MAFSKKTWLDRIAEYPTRRRLKKSDGTDEIVSVSREEGAISQEGDAFSAANMNDLEDRVASEFNSLNLKMESAITTSNISKQSVNYANSSNYANSADSAKKLNGYIEDIGTATNATWVLVNNSGRIQHRELPTNLVTYNWYNGLNAINSIRGGWQSDGSMVLDWMFGVNDCIRILFVPSTGYFCIQKQVGGKWTSLGNTFLKIGG